MRTGWLALLLLLALLVPGSPQAQKNAGGTANLGGGPAWSDSYYQNVPVLTEVATHEGYDPLVKEFTKACNENAAALDATTRKVGTAASRPGLSSEMRNRGQVLIQEGKTQATWSRRMGQWAENFGRFLKAVDFVSTSAQAAGYLVEGDRTGATSVVVNDISKKTCAGAGAFVLSGIPVVGQAAGAAAGEEFHNRNLKPVIEAREDQIRNAQAQEKMLGKPWLPPNQFINPDGKVYELPPEYFFNPAKGRIDRRGPEEQKQYEDQMRTRWLDGKALTSLEDKALAGEISPEQYGRALDSYRRRDRKKPWKPELEPGTEETARPEGEGGEADGEEEETDGDEQEDEQEDEPGQAGGGDDRQEPRSGGAREQKPPKQESGGILDFVSPQRVTATGSTQQDLSAGEFRNIATTTFVLSFWNVGGMAAGYGGARMTSTTTFTMHPAVEKTTCSGSFSGGPNGSFTLNCGGDATGLRLSNGQSVSGGGIRLSVQNPGAFSDWPKNNR